MENLTCMAFSGTSHAEVLAAGAQNSMLLLNVDRGTIVKQVSPRNDAQSNNRNPHQTGTPNFVGDE
jgi:hypothetical protein